MSYVIKTKRIDELQVNKYNPRFVEVVKDETDAINKIIDLNPKKMLNLLKSIDEDGWHNDFFIAYENAKTKEISIMDGNRRLSALKIIMHPGLITINDQNAKIIEKCNEIDKNKVSNLNLYLEAWPDLNDSLYKRIEAKHIKDDAQVMWTPMAKYRFSLFVGSETDKWIRILIYYYKDDEKIDKILDKKVDIFRRILTRTHTSTILKIDKTLNKFDYTKDKKLMDEIVKYVNEKRIHPKKALTREEDDVIASELAERIKTVIGEVPPIIEKKEKDSEDSKGNKPSPKSGEEKENHGAVGEAKRRHKHQGPKNMGLYLIPKQIPINNIKLTKILDLIDECQHLSLYEYPHAACYVFRSILRMSIENFVSANPSIDSLLPVYPDKNGNSKKSDSLADIAKATAQFLNNQGQINRQVLDSILDSIDNQKIAKVLNEEIHSFANGNIYYELANITKPLLDLILAIA